MPPIPNLRIATATATDDPWSRFYEFIGYAVGQQWRDQGASLSSSSGSSSTRATAGPPKARPGAGKAA